MLIVPILIAGPQGIMNTMHYYEVAPNKVIRANSNTYTYASPKPLAIGSLVIVTIGKQEHVGLVTSEVKKPNYETKEIAAQLDLPPLPTELVQTALWMAEYYHTHMATVLQTLLPRGLTKKRRVRKASTPDIHRKRTNFLLNKQQSSIVDQLATTSPGTALLHGVTGSGKTAVYIEYAKHLIAEGKSVIVLVPEIALTSQLIAEFRHYFPDIILTHSKQTEAERHLSWLTALTSVTPHVAIGPRSALFLPLKNLGAIIIDEAHEPSFKQEQSPRYSALRVAGVLAKTHEALALQGTATPLISEYYLALHHNRPILALPERARSDATKPEITLVDMTKKSHFSRHRLFSDELLETITQTLENGGQALIFHNRRGSASTTLCESCGWSAMCARCFVPYTLHADSHQLRCHICNSAEKVPTSCPICQSTDIIHKGIGTKLIEAELQKLFPNKKIARFDGDTQDSDTVEKQYQALYNGEIEIIVGTQVIAKGLDLPKLRAVGVVQADAGLSLPDFSASERTFQLLAQVIGRVGRSSHPTSVVIQSYQSDAAAVRYGIAQDYTSFYNETLPIRKQASFPPFTYLLQLTCVYKTEAAAIRNAQTLAKSLRATFDDILVLGPTPAFYERQHDTYRWQLTVKSASRARLLKVVDALPPNGWQYNLDPSSLL